MPFSCGMDLSARACQVCVIDEDLSPLVQKKVRHELPRIIRPIEPFKETLQIVVESTFNGYWLVAGLQAAGSQVCLAHRPARTAADRSLQPADGSPRVPSPGGCPGSPRVSPLTLDSGRGADPGHDPRLCNRRNCALSECPGIFLLLPAGAGGGSIGARQPARPARQAGQPAPPVGVRSGGPVCCPVLPHAPLCLRPPACTSSRQRRYTHRL
jgi:hypothetical protein